MKGEGRNQGADCFFKGDMRIMIQIAVRMEVIKLSFYKVIMEAQLK
jgi:hypothetical protein